MSGVTIATSLLRSTRDFLNLSFHMFPHDKILKVFKIKIWLDIWNQHSKLPPNTKCQLNQSRGLRVTSTGFPHFFIHIFQDFSRSDLTFSRTVVCGKNCLGGGGGEGGRGIERSCQKYSFLISNVFEKMTRIFPGHFHFFPGDSENLFFHFQGLPGFPGCVGTLEYLKFRPAHCLKYRLWRHNYVIVVMLQTLSLPL